MKKLYLRCLAMFALLTCNHYSSFAQTKLTNFANGTATASGGLFPYGGNSIYFINRASSADNQEWSRLNLADNSITSIWDNHANSTTVTIFRSPVRLGNNVFVSAATNSDVNDLEFSRFNLAGGNEQIININPGTVGSDPSQFGLDAATGKVYFKPYVGSANQIWVWNPSDSSVSQLTNISGGIQQNSTSNIVIVGNFIYTAATIGSATGLIKVNKTDGTYTFYSNGIYSPENITAANGNLFFYARSGTSSADPLNVFMFSTSTNALTQRTFYSSTQTTTNGNIGGFALSPNQSTLFINISFGSGAGILGEFLTVNTTTGEVTKRTISGTTDRMTYLWGTNTSVYVQRWVGNSASSRTLYKINLSDGSNSQINSNTYTTFGAAIDGQDGSIYMSATEPTTGSEVYTLNLATDAVTRLTDINSNSSVTSGNSSPGNLVAYNSKLYFTASATGTAIASANYEIYSLPIGAILPLKWISFTATPTNLGNIQLEWKVAEMQGVKGFDVEVSADGRSWNTAGNVAATNAASYQYTDKGRAEKVIYYRIKEVSVDGSYTYSQVQKVVLPTKSSIFVILNNPSRNKTVTVEFSATAEKGSIGITDANGRIVAQKQWNGGAGKLQITVPSPGTYNVNFNSQNLRAVVQ